MNHRVRQDLAVIVVELLWILVLGLVLPLMLREDQPPGAPPAGPPPEAREPALV